MIGLRRDFFFGGVLCAGMLAAGSARVLAEGGGSAEVDAAFKALQAEADANFVDNSKVWIAMARPRPAVAKLDPALYETVLKALTAKSCGDTAKDAYVRYHMMWVVNQALPGLEKPISQPLLMQLIRAIPDDIKYTVQPWTIYDPPEIGVKYRQLIDSCIKRVGFPPFVRSVYPPESFEYMDGAERSAAEKRYAEAKSMEGKFKQKPNPEGNAYNYRMSSMDWALRQYRCELFYGSLVKNPAALADLTDAIYKAAPTSPERATDLASALNMAYFNGILGGYNKDVLRAAAAELAASKKKKVPVISYGWDDGGGRWRQLGEALFTVMTGIETNYIPQAIAAGKYSRPLPPPPPPAPPAPKPAPKVATTKGAKPVPETQPAPPPPIKPEEVTVAEIDAAIAKAIPALEGLRPPEIDLGGASYGAIGLPYWPTDLMAPGQTALSTWGMLAAGEPYMAPWMLRRVGWVMSYDSPSTYDRAMRLQMYSMVTPSERKAIIPWVRRDTKWLLDTMTEEGGWEAQNTGTRSTGWGDDANSAYAMLGLWGASQSGFEVPDAAWQKMDKYWREAQRPAGAPGEGAWAVTPAGSLKKGASLKAFTNQVSAAMTAGGVLSLYITESFLYGEKRAEVGQSHSPELLKGLSWLDNNFSLTQLDGDSDFYYYAWTIENVGNATGYRTFNKVDWYREATAMLLNKQGKDGLWDGPKGKVVSTSFALLYLYRARGPLAICKLKIDPVAVGTAKLAAGSANAWNNRPNDLYNFTRDVSKKTEVPTSWQIADLDQPVSQLIESPILYLATDRPFKLSAAHLERLKEYLAAGGMLVCVPEGKAVGPALVSMKALAAELQGALAPGREPVSRQANDKAKHAFYTLFATVEGNMPTVTYDGKLRPLVVVVEKDIGRDLQMNRIAQREAFDLLENIYLFATGKNAKRPRISPSYLTQHVKTFKAKLAVARITHAGEFDPEPQAMGQMKALLADEFGVDLNVQAVAAGGLTKEMKVAFLTVSDSGTLTDEEAAQVKAWVDAGGTLWMDAAGGTVAAVDKVHDLMGKVGLTDLQSFDGNEVMTGKGLKGGYDVGEPEVRRFFNTRSDRTVLRGKITGTHPSVLVVNGDLSAGLAGMNHWGIAGYSVKTAREMVANSLLLAVKENLPPPPATAPATGPATGPATKPAATMPTKN